MAIGVHLLALIIIKHLLTLCKNHCFDPFFYSWRALIFTTASSRPLSPLVTMERPQLNNGRVKLPLSLSGQPFSTLLLPPSSPQWPSMASKAIPYFFTPPLSYWTRLAASPGHKQCHGSHLGTLERATVRSRTVA